MTKPSNYVVANDTGANVRSDINDIFEAIQINNGYGSEPTTKGAYMWYADTVANKMSFYKSDAATKISFIHLANGNFFGPDGSAGSPSYTFENQSSTGFYKAGTNVIGVSNNSNLTAEFKTDGTLIKGILDVIPSSGAANFTVKSGTLDSQDANINLIADTAYTTASSSGLQLIRKAGQNGVSEVTHRGTGDLVLNTIQTGSIGFTTNTARRWTMFGASGEFISGDASRNALQSHGAAFHFSGTNFNGLSLCKNAYDWGTPLFIQVLSATGTKNILEIQYNANASGQGTAVGGISTNGSSTSFNTSSDYRLKENVVAISDGITRLKTLKPYRFNFISDKDTTVDGFFAHEVTAVPEAVTGTKDETDSDNNPKYQGIDQSKIVPLLVAALQEAVAKIETLETKVAALEGS